MKRTIRTAKISDTSAIAGFQLLMAAETEKISLNEEILYQGVEAVFADPAKGIYYLAETDGIIIASLMITHEWSDWRNGLIWWIQSVYVKPEFRNTGVFRKMYRHIRNTAENDPGVIGIRLYVDKRNATAQQVYRSIGMDGEHYQVFEWLK